MRWPVLVLINVVLVLYLLIGGVVFWCLESRHNERTENHFPPHVNLTSSDVIVTHVEQLINYITSELDRQQTQMVLGNNCDIVFVSFHHHRHHRRKVY